MRAYRCRDLAHCMWNSRYNEALNRYGVIVVKVVSYLLFLAVASSVTVFITKPGALRAAMRSL